MTYTEVIQAFVKKCIENDVHQYVCTNSDLALHFLAPVSKDFINEKSYFYSKPRLFDTLELGPLFDKYVIFEEGERGKIKR